MSDKIDWLRLERDESIYRSTSVLPGSKEKILDAVARSAYNNERAYSGCTRSVLTALNEHLHLLSFENFKHCFRACTALAGGVARMGEICGALTGAIIAIGLAFGPERFELYNEYSKTMEIAADFFNRFKNKFGCVRCSELQEKIFGRSYDLKDPREREAWVANGGLDKCPLLCAEVARMAAEFILDVRASINP
ncbi:MAG: C_GCAxxG_C_C family protein [Synergistetes bacterium]|nr:C_GCAxxG_C_C family protein [Synergistota bacterium]